MSLPTSIAFSYAAMPESIAARAQEVIKASAELHSREAVAMVRIGIELLAIKSEIDHGLFAGWLKAEFPLGMRMAEHYMAAARRVDEENAKRVSHLPKRVQIQLFAPSTPDAIVKKVIAADEPLTSDSVLDLIDTARKASSRERALAKAPPTKRRQLLLEERRIERANKESDQKRELAKDAAQQAFEIIYAAVGEAGLPGLNALMRDCDIWQLRNLLVAQEMLNGTK